MKKHQKGYIDGDVLLLIACVVAALLGCYWIYKELKAEQATAAKFMIDCQSDGHKEYECVALWRAGDSRTAVVPVFMGGR